MTQITEDEGMGYKDLPVEAYEFSALLQLGTTYELMEFLARAQVVAATRMADEHVECKMIQRALAGELEPQEDRALQKIGRKKQPKSTQLLIELPDLNAALVEAYRALERTTRAAKQITRCSKTARKHAQWATELWQVSEHRIVVLEQQLQDCQSLGRSQLYHSQLFEATMQADEASQPASNPVEVSTQKEIEQPPVSTSTEKST